MALNTFKCNCLTPLHFKGLNIQCLCGHVSSVSGYNQKGSFDATQSALTIRCACASVQSISAVVASCLSRCH